MLTAVLPRGREACFDEAGVVQRVGGGFGLNPRAPTPPAHEQHRPASRDRNTRGYCASAESRCTAQRRPEEKVIGQWHMWSRPVSPERSAGRWLTCRVVTHTGHDCHRGTREALRHVPSRNLNTFHIRHAFMIANIMLFGCAGCRSLLSHSATQSLIRLGMWRWR